MLPTHFQSLKATGNNTSKGVSFTVEPEYRWAEKNATLKAKFVNDRTIEGSVALADLGQKGIKVELAGKQDADEKRSVSTSLSFVNEKTNVKGTATFPIQSNNAPTVNVDAVLRYPQNLYWGVNAKHTWGTSKVDWNARVQMVDGDHTMGFLLYVT